MTTQQEPEAGEEEGRAALNALAAGRFAGREPFREKVRATLALAAQQKWREAIFCDADFSDWPLGERAVDAALNDWARAGGRFVLIAQNWDEVPRRHARLVQWRQRWSHLIECRACRDADPSAVPSAIWSPMFMLQRFERDRSAGVASINPQRRVELREMLDQWWHRSSPAFAATTLGL